ncbi:MAG: hypothetical protein A2X49_16430 [Lentisphaerae bacterium GWF2_52_8]|nr:MAG: hypothetical protein A2X49_16430 [Lentisphaerae bacterium GWF2_52_8]
MTLSARFEESFPLIASCLQQARLSGRLAHAYLLFSDSLSRRRELALALGQLMLCQNPSPEGKPCASCKVCRQIESESYPELYILAPSSSSRIIPVGENDEDEDSVRWFQNLFYVSSTGAAGKKLGIILDADRMEPPAQNAFLKTLEEPPPDTVFILATGKPSVLLPTIISRCQMLPLLENRCPYEFSASEILFPSLKKLQFDAIGKLVEAESCASAIIAATELLEDEAKEKIGEKWQDKLATLDELAPAAQKRVKSRHEAAESAAYRLSRESFLSAIHAWFAQVYLLSCGAQFDELPNPEIFANLISTESPLPSEQDALAALGKAEKLLGNLSWNVNEELALREFCLSIALSRN